MTGWKFVAQPAPAAAATLAILRQLEASQWLPAGDLQALQLRQLAPLLRHAHASTAFYARHWGKAFDPAAPLDAAAFARLPVLTRRDLQEHYEDLKSRALPRAHGDVGESRTSGSSGSPVRLLKTSLVGLFWRAMTLREHAWHQRDLGGKLAVIRRRAAKRADNWGSSTRGLVATGPLVGMEPDAGIEEQLGWLEREKPDYLLTYPSLAAELARGALERGLRFPFLKQVRTIGELLPPETRAACREAWGVAVVDVYSAEEAGYLALQCPVHEHYHAQSEGTLLEVVDDAGQPCRPGEIGRVLVTPLHNFATPLVRYDLGDYAELGAPCDCGRALPVLRRVVGRVRNMFVTATGERIWPSFSSRSLAEAAPILQHQFVQKTADLVEARLVTSAPLTAEQEGRVRTLVLARLPAGTRLEFAYVARIERSAGGKFEDFKSEVAPVKAP